MVSQLLGDLGMLERRLVGFSGGREDFDALVDGWAERAPSAQVFPAYVSRLRSLEPLPLALTAQRLRDASRYFEAPLEQLVEWLVSSRENTNYTYDLTDRNLRHLGWFVANVTGITYAEARGYMDELESDEALPRHIRERTRTSQRRLVSDEHARYGRRLGWYAFVRATKPRVVVETGVDKGLGTCVLASALLKNAAEGAEGKLIAMDIEPSAGELVLAPYSSVTEIVYGDAIGALQRLTVPVDIFVHDSDHRAEHERAEFEAVADKLGDDSLVLSDNAHDTQELAAFAERTGRCFTFFREEPRDHFHPGAGIGVAF